MNNEGSYGLMALTGLLRRQKILAAVFILAASLSLLMTAAAPVALAELAAPTDLSLSKNSDGDVVLSWINNAPEGHVLGYIVERQEKGVGAMTSIETLAGSVNTYVDVRDDASPLTANTTYQYRVKAFSFDDESAYSNVAEIKILFSYPDPHEMESMKPSAPTELAATATDSTHVSLSWTDNADNETAYVVKRQIKDVGNLEEIIDDLPADTTSWIDDTVSPETTYVYAVCCKKTMTSNDSNLAEVTTPASALPAAPENLTATVNGLQVTLNWNDLSTNEDGFIIERSLAGSSDFDSVHTIGADLASYVDNSVVAGQSYDYRVCATNAAGRSPYSNIATAAIPSEDETATVLKYYIGNLQYMVNGQPAFLDSVPVVVENRILLPIRFVVDPLGGTAAWNQDTKQATVNCNGHTIILTLNSNTALVDGASQQIDPDNASVMPQAIDNRILMPLRFVGESLDCGVAWNQEAQEAVLTYPNPQ